MPSDELSASDHDDDADNESESDSEPEIVRKIKKTVYCLSNDSESGSVEQQVSADGSDIYAAGGLTWQNQDNIQNLKISGVNSGVKQIPTDCISVSELRKETNLYHYQTLLEDFFWTYAQTCARENIQKEVKLATCRNSVWCISTRVNVSRVVMHSTSSRTFSE
jgi:hypothetical protein